MEPLKITFRIGGGLAVPPYPIHLDALLAYGVTRVGMDPGDPDAPNDICTLRELALDLPLARYEHSDGEWVWKASALVSAGIGTHSTRFYTQRLNKKAFATHVGDGSVQFGRYRPDPSVRPGDDMQPYQYKIDTARGAQRNLCATYPLMEVAEMSAWCVGDPEQLEDMLVHRGIITHVGARRRAGHGRIVSVMIEPCPDAAELWKLRVRPWKMLDDDAPIQAAWRAPYWAAENRGQAFCPTRLI